MIELFAKSEVMGTFKGFSERGYEFAAEIVAPYDASMLDRPQLGQFVLIELASVEEAALGRITKYVPTGLLSSSEGEDYVNTMQERGYEIPEDLKKHKLKYRVQIKLLGAVKVNQEGAQDDQYQRDDGGAGLAREDRQERQQRQRQRGVHRPALPLLGRLEQQGREGRGQPQ